MGVAANLGAFRRSRARLDPTPYLKLHSAFQNNPEPLTPVDVPSTMNICLYHLHIKLKYSLVDLLLAFTACMLLGVVLCRGCLFPSQRPAYRWASEQCGCQYGARPRRRSMSSGYTAIFLDWKCCFDAARF